MKPGLWPAAQKTFLELNDMDLHSFISTIRRHIYLLLGNIDNKLGRQTQLFVLCYHGINNDDWRFNLSSETFLQQISWLQSRYEIIDFNTFAQYLEKGIQPQRPSVLLTFDDGYRNILEVAPALQAQSIKPVAFVLTNPTHAQQQELGSDAPLLTLPEIKRLTKMGWEIGVHSATHADFSQLNAKTLATEIPTLPAYATVPAFAFPKGRYTAQVLQWLQKRGYQFGFTMNDGFITHTTSALEIPRIGVDRSHTFAEFKVAMSPSNILFRKIIKNSFVGKYLV